MLSARLPAAIRGLRLVPIAGGLCLALAGGAYSYQATRATFQAVERPALVVPVAFTDATGARRAILPATPDQLAQRAVREQAEANEAAPRPSSPEAEPQPSSAPDGDAVTAPPPPRQAVAVPALPAPGPAPITIVRANPAAPAVVAVPKQPLEERHEAVRHASKHPGHRDR